MRETFDEDIKRQMNENFLKMKKINASYKTLLFMSLVLFIIQFIFFIVGALNVYMLEGAFMNVLVYIIGTQKFGNKPLQYTLLGINLAIGIAFIVVHPISELLLRMGVIQHFYLAAEMFLFTKLGERKTELSYELGYPYFNELAAYNTEDTEYVPENDITSGQNEMDAVSEAYNTTVSLRKTPVITESAMDNIDTSALRMEFVNDAVKAENPYQDRYTVKPQIVQKEPEYDRELFARNSSRMKTFKLVQKALFMVNLILFVVFANVALNSFMSMFKYPAEVFGLFPFIAVAVASLITVTCLDKRDIIKLAMYAFASIGVVFSVLSLDVKYLGVYVFLALQMFISFKLADEQDYLKTQFGYPYFKEMMIKHQRTVEDYAPQHKVNFSERKMDEI